MGSGERVAVELNGGAYSKVYSLSRTNPYMTIDGISRTESLTYRDVTQFVSSSSSLSSKTLSAGLTFDYPITEYQYVRFGGSLESSQLLTSSLGSAIQAQQWVQNNGKPYERIAHDDLTNADYLFFGTKYKAAEVIAGWGWDTRNRTLFANRGMRQSITVSSTIPGSEVQYWVANYSFLKYVPLWHSFALAFNAGVDYGGALGKTTALPPYRQFYGGGPDSVRGFRESRLGPKDNFGNPYGGNLRIVSQNELIFPMPSKWATSARVSAFFDIGNVFSTGNGLKFYGPDGVTPNEYNFDYHNLKRSVGVAVQWLAPLGLFRFSFGIPLNAVHGDTTHWGDETEGFQFSIGQAF
jgi:outer membrane protein insertion porin family